MDWWMIGKAALVGGCLCVIGQLLIDYTRWTPARILVGYVVTGVALTALGLYEPLVNWGGCGATVPLTGFGYALANGAREGVDKQGLLGALAGGLTGTAIGITTAISLGLTFGLVAKSGDKA